MNSVHKQKPHKPTKINISFEIKAKPNNFINDPNRYHKLLNSNKITTSTVSNLPLGSINKTHYNYDFYYQKNKPIINKSHGKSFENINKVYLKEPNHSFIDRLKYSKSIEKMYLAKKPKYILGAHSAKKKNINIRLSKNNNYYDNNSFYNDNTYYINTSSTNYNHPKHNNSYKLMKPITHKKKYFVNNEVQIISLSNEGNYNHKKNKINKKNKDIDSKIKKINVLLDQIAIQKKKMKQMADKNYYSNSMNNQNSNQSKNEEKILNTEFNLTHKIANSFACENITNQKKLDTNIDKKNNIKSKNKCKNTIVSTTPLNKIKKIRPKKIYKSDNYNKSTSINKKINKKIKKNNEEDLYKTTEIGRAHV